MALHFQPTSPHPPVSFSLWLTFRFLHIPSGAASVGGKRARKKFPICSSFGFGGAERCGRITARTELDACMDFYETFDAISFSFWWKSENPTLRARTLALSPSFSLQRNEYIFILFWNTQSTQSHDARTLQINKTGRKRIDLNRTYGTEAQTTECA